MAKSSTAAPKTSSDNGTTAARRSSSNQPHPTQDITQYLKEYARARPEVAAMWCFGLGFVLGWKLKPW